MKRIGTLALLLCGLLLAPLLAASARGAELNIGDPAPKLQQGKYVQGEAVTSFEKGKVYVVEMWATWCGPCIAAIPHVNEMQKAYADQGLIVIGQNVWEQDAAKVEPFVKKMGEKMTYRVAYDDVTDGPNMKGKMAVTWMKAADRNGIPCSFIVNRDGVIAWIGHPMTMEEPLKAVLAGTWDVAAAKAEAANEQAAKPVVQEAVKAAQAKDWAAALAKLDEAEKLSPKSVQSLATLRYTAYGELKQPEKATAYAEQLAQNAKDQPLAAIGVGEVAFRHKDYDLAQKLAAAGAEHGKTYAFVGYELLARVHAAKSEWAEAAAAQRKALEAAPEQAKAPYEKSLKGYEEKAAKTPA